MTTTKTAPPARLLNDDDRDRAAKLGLWGIHAHWGELAGEPWLPRILELEEQERGRRSLERRLAEAKLGRFKPMADFDWQWPESIDRESVEDLFELKFISEALNVILIGTNGVGKTMIAQNLGYSAVLRGHTVRMVNASALLADLASQESSQALERRLRRYAWPQLLVIDEVGYLSSSAQHVDLLFEVASRRYEHASTIVTTNKPFQEWNQIFPNSGSVVSLIDRLVHRSEVLDIHGKSYRLKEAEERKALGAKRRAQRRGRKR